MMWWILNLSVAHFLDAAAKIAADWLQPGLAAADAGVLENGVGRLDDEYDRFRDAYKRRLAGYDDDEFQGISDDRLINAQKSAQKNKSISIIVTVAFYLLNVVDANVDAHLRQYEVSEDLSLQPNFDYNQFNAYKGNINPNATNSGLDLAKRQLAQNPIAHSLC